MSEHSSGTVPLTGLVDVNPPTSLPHDSAVSFIGMEDVSEDFNLLRTRERNSSTAFGYTRFRENDILFAKITPCMENGKGAVAEDLIHGFGFGSTEFHVLRPTEGNSSFIAQWMRSPAIRRSAEAYMTGSAGQRRVPADFFSRYQVPFFSLAEQRRIAEILDTLDDQIRATKQIIEKLSHARRGLLEDVLSKEARLAPNSWHHTTLGELITDIRYGTSESSNDNDSGTPVLRIPNVLSGKLDFSDLQYQSPSITEKERYSAKLDELVVIRTNGNPTLLGQCARIDDQADGFLFASYLIRIRLDQERLLPEFAVNYMKTENVKSYIRSCVATSAGNYNLNIKQLRSTPIVVPSLADQKAAIDLTKASELAEDAEHERLNKLTALKQGLMADLLTGKVRVETVS